MAQTRSWETAVSRARIQLSLVAMNFELDLIVMLCCQKMVLFHFFSKTVSNRKCGKCEIKQQGMWDEHKTTVNKKQILVQHAADFYCFTSQWVEWRVTPVTRGGEMVTKVSQVPLLAAFHCRWLWAETGTVVSSPPGLQWSPPPHLLTTDMTWSPATDTGHTRGNLTSREGF